MVFKSPIPAPPISNKDILSWMFDEQKYDPDKPIFIDTHDPARSISSHQARTFIRQIAAGLKAHSLKAGDCVCVNAYNDIYYPMLFLGIVAAGGVFGGQNPSYTSTESKHHLETTQAKFLITEPDISANLLTAARSLNIASSNIWIFDVQPSEKGLQGFQSWTELLQHGETDWVTYDDEQRSAQTTIGLMFSSGTTGLPKGAMLSNRNFIAQNTLAIDTLHKPYQIRRLIYLPLYHVAMAPIVFTTALRNGEQSYIMRRYEFHHFLDSIQRYQLTDVPILGPIALQMLQSPETKRYSMESVRLAYSGGAPLDKETQNELARRVLKPGTPYTQIWAMTECSCVATQVPWPELDDTGSVGYIVPGMEMRLVDEEGAEITTPNKPGEIWLRGPTIFQGYYRNPTATSSSFDKEGYFKTGDIAYCDDRTKKWYIVDRAKELIKVRAFQVAPAELEGVLILHPKIADAAVIGVNPVGAGTELPRAYIVRESGEGATLTVEEVHAFAAERLAKYKQLAGGVVFTDAIPKNPIGKKLKRILRERAKEEMRAEGGSGQRASKL